MKKRRILIQNLKVELYVLAKEVQKCTKCDAYKDCNYRTPGMGAYEPKLFIVGGASSVEDDIMEEPFSGRQGDYLKKLLKQSNIEIKDVYFTNSIKCKTTKPKYLNECRYWLEKELDLLKPKAILALGNLPHTFFANVKYNDSKHFQENKGVFAEKNGVIRVSWYHPVHILNSGKKMEQKTLQILNKIKEIIYA